MSRVTAPFLSIAASGTIGKTLTASKWKGRAYMRLRVIPKNLRSAGQQLTRGYLGAIAKAAQAVLTAAKDNVNAGSQFFLDTLTHISGTTSWVAKFQQNEHNDVSADQTTYSGLGGVVALYEAEAATEGLFDYITVGSIPVTYTAGFQLYMLAKFAASSLHYLGFAGGIDSATAPELAAFTTYVQTTV